MRRTTRRGTMIPRDSWSRIVGLSRSALSRVPDVIGERGAPSRAAIDIGSDLFALVAEVLATEATVRRRRAP